jgi:hypothetical protein
MVSPHPTPYGAFACERRLSASCICGKRAHYSLRGERARHTAQISDVVRQLLSVQRLRSPILQLKLARCKTHHLNLVARCCTVVVTAFLARFGASWLNGCTTASNRGCTRCHLRDHTCIKVVFMLPRYASKELWTHSLVVQHVALHCWWLNCWCPAGTSQARKRKSTSSTCKSVVVSTVTAGPAGIWEWHQMLSAPSSAPTCPPTVLTACLVDSEPMCRTIASEATGDMPCTCRSVLFAGVPLNASSSRVSRSCRAWVPAQRSQTTMTLVWSARCAAQRSEGHTPDPPVPSCA